MIAAFIFAIAVQTAPESFSGHSAQCLAEVAGMTLDQLELDRPAQTQALVRKTDELIGLLKELDQVQAELQDIQLQQLARAPDRISKGELPIGSEAIYREQIARDHARYLERRSALRARAPNCAWPAPIDAPAI